MVYKFTDAEVAQFKRDGFFILPVEKHKLVEPNTLFDWAYEIKKWPKIPGKWMAYDETNLEGNRQMMKMEYFSHYHEGMKEFLYHGDILKLLEQLSGGEMCLFKDKINYKAPKGNGFLPHIDAPSYDQAAKVDHLTALIAADENTLENGCLEVVPGSHKMEWEMDPEWVKKVPTTGILSKKWEAEHEWVPALLKPGDILFFGSHLAHRSGLNDSKKSRASVYATFAPAENNGQAGYDAYYADRRKTYPPEYERVPGKDYTTGYNWFAPAAPGEIKPEAPSSLRAETVS
jgi:hypothetical protein